jgi:GntR family transcriptional regulator of vanillate catabolism
VNAAKPVARATPLAAKRAPRRSHARAGEKANADATVIDRGASQTLRAQLRLRELIVGGGLPAGERIPELTLVERLGVSRTPVRAALQRLQEEGLLEALSGGGYAVRAFDESDIADAIELRGTLEGLAARLAAERGINSMQRHDALECLGAIDALLAESTALSAAGFARYVQHNRDFHALLAEMSGSALVRRQIERAITLPFASPNAFVMVHTTGPQARDTLVVAQSQHHAVLAAIERREGARAAALMQEHAQIARANLREALQSRQALQRVPGARLIRRSGR